MLQIYISAFLCRHLHTENMYMSTTWQSYNPFFGPYSHKLSHHLHQPSSVHLHIIMEANVLTDFNENVLSWIMLSSEENCPGMLVRMPRSKYTALSYSAAGGQGGCGCRFEQRSTCHTSDHISSRQATCLYLIPVGPISSPGGTTGSSVHNYIAIYTGNSLVQLI